jgi:hypothetical protein
MSGERRDVDSEVVLPAGMEIVVPPAATEPTAVASSARGASERPAPGLEQVLLPPFVHGGEPCRAPAL